MGVITIRRHEDVLEIRGKMLHGLKSVKALSVKKYSGRLKLKEEPMDYQKRVRQEWNEFGGIMSDTLRARYQRESFFPTWLGMFVNPFYFARKGLAAHVRDLGRHISGRTLDVGCGSKPYEQLYASTEYVGLEYDTPQNRAGKKADHFYDGETFPFGDGEFDSVVANEVFEHVFNPDGFLDEMHRVLKPGGMVLMTMPFVWDEHEQPHDFARYSSFGIRHLLEQHGFEIVEQRKSTDDVRVIFQMINAYIYKKTVTSNGWINLAITALLMAPFNLLGELLGWLLPRNPDLYLDNVVLARWLSDSG